MKLLKLDEYSLVHGTNGDFHTITFITNGGYKIHFTVSEDSTYFDTDTATLDEIKEAIAIIESGKLEIEV
jgi:hypothetical protein